jgi:hypothetical protein
MYREQTLILERTETPLISRTAKLGWPELGIVVPVFNEVRNIEPLV